MLHAALVAGLPDYLWHPLRGGNGYNSWSGWVSDVGEATLITAILASLATWWRKHNCHVHKCWRLSWHAHPGHGHPVCRKHHPYGQGRGDHLDARHHSAIAHELWPKVQPYVPFTDTATASGPFDMTVTTTGSVDHEVVVGAPEPEKPKKKRERKPGTEPVTDITTKQKPDG